MHWLCVINWKCYQDYTRNPLSFWERAGVREVNFKRGASQITHIVYCLRQHEKSRLSKIKQDKLIEHFAVGITA